MLENAKVAYQMFVFYWQALACFIIIFSDSNKCTIVEPKDYQETLS